VDFGLSLSLNLATPTTAQRDLVTSTDSRSAMSLIAVPRQRQTQFNDRNAEISGSSSTSLKTAGIKKWKSLTRKKESKKESSPPLRQASLAIDVCVDLHFGCDPIGPGAVYRTLYSSHAIRGDFKPACWVLPCLSRSIQRTMCHMMTSTGSRIWTVHSLCVIRLNLRQSFRPGGDPSGGRSV